MNFPPLFAQSDALVARGRLGIKLQKANYIVWPSDAATTSARESQRAAGFFITFVSLDSVDIFGLLARVSDAEVSADAALLCMMAGAPDLRNFRFGAPSACCGPWPTSKLIDGVVVHGPRPS